MDVVKCCKDCTDRWVNETGRCHDTCEKYIEACKRVKEINAKRRKNVNYDHIAYVESVINKRRRRNGN